VFTSGLTLRLKRTAVLAGIRGKSSFTTGEAKTAIDALQFSQAACNVANAMAQMQNIANQREWMEA